MRLSRCAAPARNLPPPVTFICHGCDCVEHRRTPALPVGWTTIEARHDIQAYCAECTEHRRAPFASARQ